MELDVFLPLRNEKITVVVKQTIQALKRVTLHKYRTADIFLYS